MLAALRGENYRVRQLVPGSRTADDTVRTTGADHYEVDLASPPALAQLHETLRGDDHATIGMIINLTGLSKRFAAPGLGEAAHTTEANLGLFNVIKEFQSDLCESATRGGGRLVNVITLDGQFGFGECDDLSLTSAGTIGLCKSLAHECPQLSVTNIDVDPRLRAETLVSRLCDELLVDSCATEVGLRGQQRFELAMRATSPMHAHPELPVDADSVVLVTGGGYGITADVTMPIAALGARLIIVGRSPLADDEPDTTRTLNEADLRTHLLESAIATGEQVIPAEIERAVNRIMRQRQLHTNLAEYARLGATVEYKPCDVRNATEFTALIEDIYEKHGRLDGVIHGAGIIQDKLIRDKTPQSFTDVLQTKIDSAMTLAQTLRPEGLRFLVFFSSISARFGNAGQTDYSAANEHLNKLAQYLDRQWPGRVVAINWGPWDSGMVSDGLRDLYASRGVSLIPIAEGVRSFERELRLNGEGSPEVVISCSVEAIAQLSKQS